MRVCSCTIALHSVFFRVFLLFGLLVFTPTVGVTVLTGLITGLLAFGSNGDTVCCYSVFVCVRVRVRAFSFLILYFLLSFDNTQCRDPFLIKAS